MNVWVLLVILVIIFLTGGVVVSNLERLDAAQIAQYARNAGFTGQDLITAVAVALAESGGNAKAVGDSGTSFGLWQIHWTVHRETYGVAPEELFDPQANANAAMKVFQEQGWNAWSTYSVNNRYTDFLGAATQAVNA